MSNFADSYKYIAHDVNGLMCDSLTLALRNYGKMKVLLAFSDKSLGGTSRSALEYARIWKQAGAEVMLFSPQEVHQSRVKQAAKLGIPLIHAFTPAMLKGISLVHLHHAAPSAATISWVKVLLDAFPQSPPAFLTHNIFGQKLPLVFPADRTIVGLLGHWSAQQYASQVRHASKETLRVVPNPLDSTVFRPPSKEEHEQARAVRGIENGTKVILRVGSPNTEKWSTRPYVALAQMVKKDPRLQLRLVGCPDSLAALLPKNERIVFVPPLENDAELRNEYWCADIFAHWAKRGETFGNVLLEALGTGLPVVYKSRRLRDNTPWEFRDLERFEYIVLKNDWLSKITRSAPPRATQRPQSLFRYSSEYMIDVFSECVDYINGSPADMQAWATTEILRKKLSAPAPVSLFDNFAIFIRHNPMLAFIKGLRLRWSVL